MSRIIPHSRSIGLVVLFVAGLLLSTPVGLADGDPSMHLTVDIATDGSVDESTDGVVATRLAEEAGLSYTWQIRTASPQTLVEVRYSNASVNIERARQLVPTLDVEPPLFHMFPRAEVWETQGPARVFHAATGADGAHMLRLQIPGPGTHNLTLSRDADAPTFELGPVIGIDQSGFDQQTTSDEHTIADLRWAPADGSAAPVENPTPTYHVKHNFPIQGMQPATTYLVNVTFTDWAGNSAVSPTYTVETLPPAYEALPVMTVLSPAPNGTVPVGQDIEVRVRIIPHGGDTLQLDDVRLFVDLEERSDVLVTRAPDGVTYTAVLHDGLEEGLHVLSVEARTGLGAEEHVRWTIHAGDPVISESPGITTALWVPILLATAMLTQVVRRAQR